MEIPGGGSVVPLRPNTSTALRSQMEFYMTGVSRIDSTSLAAIPSEYCTICLERLTEDVVRLHACNHMFHTLCIICWFDTDAPRSGMRRGSCPNCRCELYEPDYRPRMRLGEHIREEDIRPGWGEGSVANFEEHGDHQEFYNDDEDSRNVNDYGWSEGSMLDELEYWSRVRERENEYYAEQALLEGVYAMSTGSFWNSDSTTPQPQLRPPRPLSRTNSEESAIRAMREAFPLEHDRTRARIRSAYLSRSASGHEGHEVENARLRGGRMPQMAGRGSGLPLNGHTPYPYMNLQNFRQLVGRNVRVETPRTSWRHGRASRLSNPPMSNFTTSHPSGFAARALGISNFLGEMALMREGAARQASVSSEALPESARHIRENTGMRHQQDDRVLQATSGEGSLAASRAPSVSSAPETTATTPGQTTIARRAMHQGLRRLSAEFHMRQLRFHGSDTDATAHDSS